MADYRGGDRHRSSYGDEAVNAIANGTTERQRQRDFSEKLIFTGIQAALQGGRAAYEHAQSGAAAADARHKDVADYIKAPPPAYKPMDAQPTDAKLPDWMTGGQGRTEYAIDNSTLNAVKHDSPNPYDDPTATKQDEDDPDAPKVTWGSGGSRRGMMGSQ